MKLALLSLPFLFFSLISGASSAGEQITEVRNAIAPPQSRGIATSDEAGAPSVEASRWLDDNESYRRDSLYGGNARPLEAGGATAYYPPTKPAPARAVPPAQKPVGTQE